MSPTFATVLHKYIRSEMFGVSLALSTCDERDDASVANAVARLERVANLLRTHGEKEDEGFLPVLRDRNPEAAARMEHDHHRLDEQLGRVRAAAAALSSADPLRRTSAVLLVYLDWNSFLSGYLAHLDDEECALFPLLGEALPGVAAMAGAALLFPPEIRAGFLESLWQAVTPGERATIKDALEAALTEQAKTNSVEAAVTT